MKAIAYFSNGLGNWILQMPAMQAVASMTDSKTIDICLNDEWRDPRRPAVEDICRAWPVVDRVISWPKNNFRPKDYDLWFYSPHGASCGATPEFLNNRRMKHPVPKPEWRSSLVHEADHYMEIAYAMGYEGLPPKVEFPLADGPVLDLPRPTVGLCNGWFRTERDHWQKKGWPFFARISGVLRRYFGGGVIGIGGKGELPENTRLQQDFTGKLSILESAKVVSQLDLLITTDTGPMHLANVLGVPLIALFGPTLVSKNGARGERSSILRSGISCSPCQDTAAFYNCRKFACMESISVGDVMGVVRNKIG